MLFAGGVSSLQSTLTPEAMWDGGHLAPILTIFVIPIPLLPHLACIASRACLTRVQWCACGGYLFLFYFSLVFRGPPQALLASTRSRIPEKARVTDSPCCALL